jgi:hypothetical protein
LVILREAFERSSRLERKAKELEDIGVRTSPEALHGGPFLPEPRKMVPELLDSEQPGNRVAWQSPAVAPLDRGPQPEPSP